MPKRGGNKKNRRTAAKQPTKEKKKKSVYKVKPRDARRELKVLKNPTRLLKWPKYIRLQRQNKILKERLKAPRAINVFANVASRDLVKQLDSLFKKYEPETKGEKKERLREKAAAEQRGEEYKSTRPVVIKYGLNHVTRLIHKKQAKLVVIAKNVDPLELVIWLPTLCFQMDVPYAIVSDKSWLGKFVHMKNATCLCLTGVKPEDSKDFQNVLDKCKSQFNDQLENVRLGPSIQGQRTRHKLDAQRRANKAATA